MKILALIAGRPKGVSEALAKEALLGAKDEGAEVEIVNLFDLTIEPCIGCSACSKKGGGRGGAAFNCFHKDDFNWVADKILDSDGLIICMPAYEKFAPGVFKTLCDRIGPYFDVAFAMKHRELLEKGERVGTPPDERLFKTRPVAFYMHGGSEWTTLGQATNQIFSISLGLVTVDRKNYDWDSTTWIKDDRFAEIRASGAHVARCAGKPEAEMTYIGDEGFCPVCHNDLMLLRKNASETVCAVCGLVGEVHTENGRVSMRFDPANFHKSHCTITGKQIHGDDLDNIMTTIMSMDQEKVKARRKNLEWLAFSKP